MVSIYVVADKDGKIKSWGYKEYGLITEDVSENILVQLVETDEFFRSPTSLYKLSGASLYKESALLLKKEKEKKVNLLNLKCQEHILSGFSFIINGQKYHFSYDQEAQLNFQDTYNLFQNNLLEEISWTVRLDNEKIRIVLKKELFLEIYRDAIKHKNRTLNYLYDDLLIKLNEANTIIDIEKIQWISPNGELNFNTEDMLEQKLQEIENIEKETTAQKGHNSYMETTLMEVADILFSSM